MSLLEKGGLMPDLIEELKASPQERALFRAAMRGALVRYAAACREEADTMVLAEDRDELLSEAAAAMARALDWEA